MSTLLANITPEVLQWARDVSGYTVDALVAKLKFKKVTAETVCAWEKGEQLPTYTQLEKLAKIYHRPIAIFYFPHPPKEQTIQEKLRSLPTNYAKFLPPNMHYFVRKAQVKQMNLSSIYGDFKPNDFQNFKNKFDNINLSNFQILAAQVRKIMGVSLEEQFKWRNSDFALKEWRSKLEKLGIWIFKDSFGEKGYFGFCLYHKYFPIIYISTNTGRDKVTKKPGKIAKQRQIFTLLHELGHLLIGKGGVDFRQNVENKFAGIHKQEEVFCNAFASEFLVPDESIEISSVPSDEKISNYARQYKVSHEVILRKYLNKGLIDNNFYDEKTRAWQQQWEYKENKDKESDDNNGGPSYYVTQKSYLGNKYLTLAFRQYYQQRITEFQLADYLGVKVKSLSGLEGYMLEGDH